MRGVLDQMALSYKWCFDVVWVGAEKQDKHDFLKEISEVEFIAQPFVFKLPICLQLSVPNLFSKLPTKLCFSSLFI